MEDGSGIKHMSEPWRNKAMRNREESIRDIGNMVKCSN